MKLPPFDWKLCALLGGAVFGLALAVDQTFFVLGGWAFTVFCWWIVFAAGGFLYGEKRGRAAGRMLGNAEGKTLGFEEGFRLAAYSRSSDKPQGVPEQELDDPDVSLGMVGMMTAAALRRHLQSDADFELVILAQVHADDDNPRRVIVLRNCDAEAAAPLYREAARRNLR